MRKLFIGLFILFILLIGAVLFLPQLVSSSVYKEKISQTLTQQLERDVRISGDVKLSVFPTLSAQTGRVEIDNPDGYKDDLFVSMDGLQARVKLLPLLSRKVEIAAFTLENPVINLEKRSDGTANWVIGDDDTPPENVSESENAPFKRDGRFADIDPQIGLFSITNGQISYTDSTENVSETLSDVNIGFKLDSLSAPVSIKGELVYNNDPLDIDFTLDTPRAFLDGQSAKISADFTSSFATINSQGEFLPSQDLDFDLKLAGNVPDMKEFAKRLPVEIPYVDLVNRIDIAGQYRMDGGVISAKDTDIKIDGDHLSANYTGDARLQGEAVQLTGTANADIRDIQAILPYVEDKLPEEVKGIELLRSANFQADLNATQTGFQSERLSTEIIGEGLNVKFDGAGRYEEDLTLNGNFSGQINSVPSLVTALDIEAPQAAALGDFNANGTVSLNGSNVKLDITEATTSGSYLSANYQGAISVAGENISASGPFQASIPSVKALNDVAALGIDESALLGLVEASGNLDYNGSETKLSQLTLHTEGDHITADFNGDAAYATSLDLSGDFSATATNLSDIARQIETEIPYIDTIGDVSAKGRITSTGDIFTVSGLDARLTNGQLNGSFTGDASTQNGFTLNGDLVADIPSIRTLAQTTGTTLPPSSSAGPIYEAFRVSGNVSGNQSAITFTNANMTLDAINATGNIDVNMSGDKPNVNGVLNLNGLDLRPYMASYASQAPTGEISQGWSEEPINLDALKLLNADITVNTPNIITDRLALGQAAIKTGIKNGRMDANIPSVSLYGGTGSVKAVVDASRNVPYVSMNVQLKELAADGFLAAIAGFTQMEGGGGQTLLAIEGSGQSQAEIMRSLTGQGDVKVSEGQIRGADMTQLLSGFQSGGLQSLLSSGTLPNGIGTQYTTKFNEIISSFAINNGVATIQDFNLGAFGMAATGGGSIDIGRQKIDFRLRPRLTGANANGIAKAGIPLKFIGDFGGVSPTLDTDIVGQLVADQARARAQQEISKALGGSVGGDTIGSVLGGVLGGNTAPANDNAQTQGAQKPEDIAGSILGGLLGGSQKPPAQQSGETPKEEKPATEPNVEDTLKGLFGRGKKKKGS